MRKVRLGIIGGGRWARVYLHVLEGCLPVLQSIIVVSPKNATGMRQWVAGNCCSLSSIISVTDRYPTSGLDCVIIVNAAHQHYASIEYFLGRGIPVLGEKPLASGATHIAQLIALSAKKNTSLAVAHVFRFAGYLDIYEKKLREAGPIKALEIMWFDVGQEQRYGEKKSYDARLPVPEDVLPHILTVIEIIAPATLISCTQVVVERGGAEVCLQFRLDDMPCQIRIARNAQRRERHIKAFIDDKIVELDFSKEPGVIIDQGVRVRLMPEWKETPSPLTQLVQAFLALISDNIKDLRLDVSQALRAAEVIDTVLTLYDEAIIRWLRCHKPSSLSQHDLDYIGAELESTFMKESDSITDDIIKNISRRAQRRSKR